MAVDLQAQRSSPRQIPGRLGQLLSALSFRVHDNNLIPRGYAQLALTTTPATPLGPIVPAGAHVVVINAEAAGIRYLDDGLPTSTYGLLLPAGATIQMTLRDLSTVSLCAAAAGAIANVLFYEVSGVPG